MALFSGGGSGMLPPATTTGTVTPLGAKRPLSAPAPTMPAAAQAGATAPLAIVAAQKARKKAAAGASSSVARPTGSIVTPILQPKALLGS